MHRTVACMMMMMMAIPAAGPAQPPLPNATASATVERCAGLLADRQAFSGVIAGKIGGSPFSIARGTLRGPAGAANSADTRFNLGSASKMFTAVAVAQLIDSGAMRLSDPIGRYVPELAPAGRAVTIRQLLTHSGGFGSFFRPDTLAALQAVRTPTDLLPLIRDDVPAFPPGSASAYSNTGFALLGIAVERASGSRFDAYLAEHVFAPAGMTRTGYAPGTESDRASGMTSQSADGPMRAGPGGPMMGPRPGGGGGPLHRRAPPDGRRLPMPPPAGSGALNPSAESALFGTPAGGAYSTGADMVRFFEALAAGRLIKPETRAMFTARQIVSAPAKGDLPELLYGFGFGVGTWNGHRWFGHNGGAPGLNVEAISFPDDDVILIVLANRDPPAATQLFRALRSGAFAPEACGGEDK